MASGVAERVDMSGQESVIQQRATFGEPASSSSTSTEAIDINTIRPSPPIADTASPQANTPAASDRPPSCVPVIVMNIPRTEA